MAGGPCKAPHLRRPRIHRQGLQAAAGAGEAAHPEAQPHRGGAAVRGGHHR